MWKKIHNEQQSQAPTLWLIGNTHIESAADWLPKEDDLCLAESPWNLIEYRICRLYSNAADQRERLTAVHRRNELITELEYHATTDSLTEIYNRRYLDQQLKQDVLASARGGAPFSVGLIDIDNFGTVNKVHGWPTGDLVLKQVSSLIRNNIRATDWVGRYGGEEFLVVLRNTNLDQARTILDRLRFVVQSTAFESTNGIPVSVTMSVGVVQHDTQTQTTPLQLLESVSRQTLAAKSAGRNCLRP